MTNFCYLKNGLAIEREIPSPSSHVIPDVLWGSPEVLFTPSYWMTQCWMQEESFQLSNHRLGRTLREEIVACLLGGYGIPAEVGIAAFERLRDRKLISDAEPSVEKLVEQLREPLVVRGRIVKYRFWFQKSRYIAQILRALDNQMEGCDSARDLRVQLMALPGIGPKTSSWIVRNWLDSDDVAILDIHIVKAGRLMNLFPSSDHTSNRYFAMEKRFLDLARAIGERASRLDALIWREMRRTPRLVAHLLDTSAKPNSDTISGRA